MAYPMAGMASGIDPLFEIQTQNETDSIDARNEQRVMIPCLSAVNETLKDNAKLILALGFWPPSGGYEF
jgi:hypothetical protein